ncbi:hypothetical protein PABY_11140 [Pyrodictium abyssi]|uniref:Split soret cytochrome c n=2 Tax=Pyrodictium abyssi TaxID=54256 RepID=A0ABM8IVF9_9CREN|nr:hypothetical protein PABY_11140 [Pyrodictium abyssi]
MEAVREGKHLHSLFQYGYGGAVGWGTLCGALNGSLAIIQMVVGEHKHWDALGKKLMRWYESTPLPSDKSNEYAVKGMMYVPKEKMKSTKWLPSNISGSTLCHVSVGKWCEISGYASGSKERSERCGRLTGDVAAMTVQLLNTYFEKGLSAALALAADVRLSPTTASCRVCHYKGKDYEAGQFTRGYLACESCHRDMRPHAHTFVSLGGGHGEAGLKGPSWARDLAIAGLGAAAAAGVAAGVLAGSGSREDRGEEEKEG